MTGMIERDPAIQIWDALLQRGKRPPGMAVMAEL
jgi:hypothetical protein